MTAAVLLALPNAAAIAQSPSPDVFETVTRGTAGLAIWRRALSHETVKAAEFVRGSQINETVTLFCGDNPHTVNHPFLNSLPEALRDDLCTLLRLFRDVAGAPNIKLRLETVDDDSCRRFHVDNVRLRLLTTYVGAGTQWALPEIEKTAIALQQAYDGPLGQLRAGGVALFRGKKCDKGAHVHHRSPPSGGGPTRLVCVIDEACEL